MITWLGEAPCKRPLSSGWRNHFCMGDACQKMSMHIKFCKDSWDPVQINHRYLSIPHPGMNVSILK